jgi:EAL and modified HD-GYP domain-containing signal transduction protein
MAIEQVYLARQPIVDRKGDLYGFELLFRDGAGPMAPGTDGMWATSTVVGNVLNEIGLQQVLGRLRGFLNVDAKFLSSDMLELLTPQRIVLEVLENTPIDQELVDRCMALRARGFDVALDDYCGDLDRIEPLLPALTMVKVDLAVVPMDRLIAVCAPLRGRGLKLVAEKVENDVQFRGCHDLGFDYFQGYHFARPELLSTKRSTRARGSMLRLLALIYSDAELAEIEEEFKRHPQLGYNLLRLVNSAAAGLSTKIASIKHGLVMLGRRQLQVWLQLLLYTGEPSERFMLSPLLQTAAMRGRLMESIAWHEDPNGEQYHDYAFMTGMLSLIDVLLGFPRAHVVEQLNVADEVRDALLTGGGRLGRLLALVELLETERRHEIDELLDGMRMEKSDLLRLEWAALRWANSLLEEGTH